ncbi:MAG: DUF1146 domain-containing protein [Mollicutes bacterium]|jgi:uncharacterized integral membrane protein (TIGR02327 family)|nr:DUF1146 domain-containing protein [Mollicutes bacterium]
MINVIIYTISILVSTFALTGINFDPIIKKNHIWEARILAIILAISFGYLVGTFIITFLESSQIIKYCL